MSIGCVVLASGESVRFGTNKLLTDFCGQPLLGWLLDMLPKTLHSVVVTRSEAVRDLAQAKGYRCLLHQLPEVRDTIRLGLSALPNTDGCLFCVGDQPLLTRETVEKVMAAYREHPEKIVRAAYDKREGNPALFPPDLYGELSSLNEGEAGVTVIRRHHDRVFTVQVADENELTDADTPETLAALEALKCGTKKE
ncbi:MAG: nucleotidyltransferase family protein [Eubacteriales bacterium]|nr:nucleotidyltransferase family protein [Eubacteriales bacterium]